MPWHYSANSSPPRAAALPRRDGRFVRPSDLLSSCFGGTYSSGDSLTNEFTLKLREGGKDVQEEAGHRIAVVGVDVLSEGDEGNAERDEFLNAFDGGGYAPPPSIEFPNEHRIDAAGASVFEQPVQFWPCCGCATPASVHVLIRKSSNSCE